MLNLRNGSKGDSNPGSLDCESGILRLTNRAPRETDEGFLLIGLYRDVWIAAIASSRTSLATLSVVMCDTSQ